MKNRDLHDVFYIDVGSNDPSIGSVTKFFYDRGARGINIDMESELIDISKTERSRDINLCLGVGNHNSSVKYFSQGAYGGLSTIVKDNIRYTGGVERETKLVTLEEICQKYIPDGQEITFLIIDVEGMEKEVLEGADFAKYRPLILIIEATRPCSTIENHKEWEKIVLENNYHFVYSHGVNRYYVANEKPELDEGFIPWSEMAANYCIMHANLLFCC